MSDALITGIIAIIVCLVNNFFQARATAKAQDVTVATINLKIDNLQRAVERHNQLIERTYHLEESTALQDAELKRINRRLENLEGKQ